MVKKTNPSSDDISVFFDAAKGTMPKDHQDLRIIFYEMQRRQIVN